MAENFFPQTESLFKPIADLVALNQSAFEALANKQSHLLSGIWSDGVDYAQKLIEEKNGNYFELQKKYFESVNQKFNEATQSSIDFFTATHGKFNDLFQESLLGGAIIEAARNVAEPIVAANPVATSPIAASQPIADAKLVKAVKVAAEAMVPAAKIKIEEPAKAKIPAKAGGKKVGGDEASVEKAIRSLLSERN